MTVVDPAPADVLLRRDTRSYQRRSAKCSPGRAKSMALAAKPIVTSNVIVGYRKLLAGRIRHSHMEGCAETPRRVGAEHLLGGSKDRRSCVRDSDARANRRPCIGPLHSGPIVLFYANA